MESTGGALIVFILLAMLFLMTPVFWSIVFGFIIHPGWFIVAFVIWCFKD